MDDSPSRNATLFNELRDKASGPNPLVASQNALPPKIFNLINSIPDHRELFSHFLSSNELFGLFNCSYHPYLKIEYTSFVPVSINIVIPKTFKNIRCVSQKVSSEGIGNEQVVAIFPENFVGIKVKSEDPVFYFVNKFVDRYLKYTEPYIIKNGLEKFVGNLDLSSSDQLNSIVANWVNLHEISHRTGYMPLPDFLFEKSGRFTAGLEELRADILAIKFCIKNSKGFNSLEEQTALYILRERLLSYPLFRGRENFDSISSILFFKFLNEMNFFEQTSLDLSFLLKILGKLECLICSFEEDALNRGESPVNRRDILTNNILNYLDGYEKQFEDYKYFWSCT